MATVITDLPPEITVLIFSYLKFSEVIENCCQTCLKWKILTAQFFIQPKLQKFANSNQEMRKTLQNEGWTEKHDVDYDLILKLYWKYLYFSGRILIMSGVPQAATDDKIEILDLLNNVETDSKLNDFLCEDENHGNNNHFAERTRAIGGIIQNKLVICGGRNINGRKQCEALEDCHVIQQLKTKTYKKINNMLHRREAAASVVLNENTLWIVGGHDGDVDLNTTEFITLDKGPIRGPDLPFTVSCHSLIQFDEKSIFLIGGLQNDSYSNRTWIIHNPNNDDFAIIEGPSLNHKRFHHSCGKMKNTDGTKTILVVAGGGEEFGGHLDSVEILDLITDEGWRLGKFFILLFMYYNLEEKKLKEKLNF